MNFPWSNKPVKNILLDINGVLFDSGEDHAIEGSVEAMNRLVEHGFKFCLVTNECTTPKVRLVEKLNKFGYLCITPDNIVSPAPVACRYLIKNKLRPRLHVWEPIEEDFQGVEKSDSPNCLVIGDVMTRLSRDFMDESLELMLKSKEKPKMIILGAGRYYKDSGRLRMDTGAYAKAFQYCLDVEPINIGKPSAEFFNEALEIVGGNESDTIMIGDDIVSDVGGAQKLGLRGFLVRTGKYKLSDETHAEVKPDHVFNDLKDAVETLCRLYPK